MTETDSRSERLQVKSRPRPGTASSNPTTSLIAPPPSVQKRNGNNLSLMEEVTPDLISFTSPPPNNKMIEICQQINKYFEKFLLLIVSEYFFCIYSLTKIQDTNVRKNLSQMNSFAQPSTMSYTNMAPVAQSNMLFTTNVLPRTSQCWQNEFPVKYGIPQLYNTNDFKSNVNQPQNIFPLTKNLQPQMSLPLPLNNTNILQVMMMSFLKMFS